MENMFLFQHPHISHTSNYINCLLLEIRLNGETYPDSSRAKGRDANIGLSNGEAYLGNVNGTEDRRARTSENGPFTNG
uniref:Uncharacterized protein n=1 Tax=Vespula pensylvanica TaxID=30213 RepID=A0A834U9F8_VESPE|nr:hypothetical protein H0235_008753 [Vespula pensylvanica]